MNLVRAVGALGVLVGLVAGIPAFLVTAVGNPFPSQVPSVDEIRIVLTQNGDGFSQFMLAVLAVIVWFLWAQVVIALLVEIVAGVRRRPTPDLPTLPGIQPLVRRLVAAITLSVSLAGAPVLAPALGALHLDAVESVSEAPTVALIDEPAPVEAEADASGPALVLHERTELWDLAEAAYGDGLAWTAIAAANVGQVDAAGSPLTATSEVVAAGTSIRLPGSIEASSVAQFGTHVVEPGESLWSIATDEANRRLGTADDAAVASYWGEVVAANSGVPSGDVDTIYPGDEVVLPGAPATPIIDVREVAAPEVASQELSADNASIDLDGVVDGPVIDDSHHLRTIAEPGETELVETELVETELVETESSQLEPAEVAETPALGEFRRRNLVAGERHDAPSVGAALAPTSSIDGQTLRVDKVDRSPAVAIVAGTAGGVLLAAGVVGALRRRRALQWRQRQPGRMPQRPSNEAAAFEAILVEAAAQVESSQLGNGWVAVSGAAVERVMGAANAISDVEEHGAAGHAEDSAIPVTAVLGTDPLSDIPLLVGFAQGSLTALDGTAHEIALVARLLILDLAVSDRVDDVHVIAVGVGGQLQDLERVEHVDDWASACVVAHRMGAVAGTGAAVVAVGILPADGDSLALLTSLGAAAVGPIAEAADRIRIDGEHAVIEPAGIEVQLAALPDREFELVAELVEATTLNADEPADVAPASTDSPLEAGHPLAPGPVEVQVLGPVEVVGAAPFSSVKAVDVVTYLAFHRQGVDADQLKTWVWPSFEPPTDKAFANVMSRARTGIGAGPEGSPYLSRAGSDRLYRLDPTVTTDFDRFCGLVELADDTDDRHQQLMVLQQALELVRGIPFSGGTATSFAWADNHVRSHVEFTIDETVHRCADLALELSDHAAARQAIHTGLRIVPGCEQCFRRRFLVARADNNRQELRRAMADLERTAAAELGEPEGIDLISRDLLMLFEELDRELIAGNS